MTFPETNLPIQVELDLGGTWTDITDDVYERDAIRITRGRSDWGGVVDPSRCTLTLKNHTGNYSPRNPRGAYYGLIGRNTPIRVSVHYGETYMDMTGTALDGATTPDHASLDITGDIDIRADVTTDQWISGQTVDLAGKYGTIGDQRSWGFYINPNGSLGFLWSPDGTFASRIAISSNAVVAPLLSGRLAARATLDVNNGSGGYTVRFYTAPTINGTWTQLGTPIIGGATTSVYASTAPMVIGDVAGIASLDMVGRYNALELRNGIGGTLVANPDFTAQTPGAPSFTDGSGRTWTLTSNSTLANKRIRFHGEISAWPVRWGTGGNDVYVPVEASGILRRLGQGASPLQSTLRRRVPSDPNLIAYWPMEEGKTATRAYSPLAGVTPMAASGLDYEQVDTLAGSSPLPALDSTPGAGLPMLTGVVPASSPGTFMVEFVYRHDSPAATLWTYMRILTTGTVREWYLQMNATGGRIVGQDRDGTNVISRAFAWGAGQAPFNAWYRMRFYVAQNGSNYDYDLNWIQIGSTVVGISGSEPGTAGRITTVGSPPGGYASELNGLALGHIAVFGSTSSTVFNFADHGYNGERAGDRIRRLRTEENLPLLIGGSLAETEPMGPQRPDTIMALLQEAADVDGGILYERRDSLSLVYRSRATLYNQPVTLSLNYQGSDGLVTPLEPVDDDQRVRNDILVTREGGGSGRSVASEGPLSTLAPPEGVGRYNEAITLNLFDDEQTTRHAEWRLHLGTWDEARYPQVRVLLQSASGVIADAVSADIGDRMQITNPPVWLPPDAIDLQVQGYTELLHQGRWELDFNCTPYGPWEIGVFDDAERGRYDTGGSTLASSATSSATTLSVASTAGPWVTDGRHYPFELVMGGEVVTAVSAGTVLTPNPLLLQDLVGWSQLSSVITYSTAVVHTDAGATASLLMTPTGASSASATTSPSSPVGSVTPGASYTMCGWVYSPTGWPDMRIITDWATAADATISTSPSVAIPVPAGVWTWITVTATAPALASRARVRARIGASPAVTDISYWWGVRLIADSTVTNSSPQTMTVVRSVNGISKDHPTGTDIRLAHSTIYAL
ncbi:hypothetical protein C5F59_027430 [Streptomyces sp. QL37]|uniref:hypothetical protein n=1 Tax=Streptomyces sp. QL37 TaxID=2093747 RepID=UPI000CF2B699|nr:hypothetical protein [Streptomyces sp. QL37]PPQ57152.1 hypothetical protein C5F59_11000 [Streptomyces sp. QL37]